MAHSLDAWDRGDHAELRAMFMEDAEKLEAAGADFFVCPDNTRTYRAGIAGRAVPDPGLHIAEVVADQAQQDGRRKVGILGTNWTMTGPVYPGALGRRGIAWAVPGEADRKIVHDIIMDELCLGTFSDESRDAYVAIIDKLADRRLRLRGAGVHRNPAADHRTMSRPCQCSIRPGCWLARRSRSRSASGRCRNGAEARSIPPPTLIGSYTTASRPLPRRGAPPARGCAG